MGKSIKKTSHINKKKWLKLGLVAAALLLIPRRSSRNTTHHESLGAEPKKESDKD